MSDQPDPAALSDDELLRAFDREMVESPAAEALLAEIQRRELDI